MYTLFYSILDSLFVTSLLTSASKGWLGLASNVNKRLIVPTVVVAVLRTHAYKP